MNSTEPRLELQAFLQRIPPVSDIRERLERTKAEAKLLRRVLRMAMEADSAGRQEVANAS